MNWFTGKERAAGRRRPAIVVQVAGVALAALVAVGSAGGFGPASAYAQSDFISLDIDKDADGVPDELAAAVEGIATAPDQEAAIKELVSKLPYAPETLALQAEAEAVYVKLEGTSDPAEAEQLQAELQKLTEKMQADPAYAKTIEALGVLFEPEQVALESVEREPGNVTTRDVGLQGVWWGGLIPGDIMLQRDYLFPPGYFIPTLRYGHAGNYHGGGLVYDSNLDGSKLRPLADWQHGLKFVGLGYNRYYPYAQPLLAQREAQYGIYGQTPYNFWFPDKWTDSALYCSQLTWKIHLLAGTDLDSNAWQYQLHVASSLGWWAVYPFAIQAVAPDEIGLSPYVRIYSADWVVNF
jgi:hypothetical protein